MTCLWSPVSFDQHSSRRDGYWQIVLPLLYLIVALRYGHFPKQLLHYIFELGVISQLSHIGPLGGVKQIVHKTIHGLYVNGLAQEG